MQRSVGRALLAIIFGLLALSAWAQVVLVASRASDDPPLLMGLQTAIGALGAAAAVGSWRNTRWAPVAAAGYGVVTAGMIVALGPLLNLDADARSGLWAGAGGVLAFGLVSAWYLRRSLRPALS
jgi:hypothetical protein